MDHDAGILYIIATPIGNLEDITLRALRLLGEMDAIACEDTRHTRKIFEKHEIVSPSKIFAYHEHNEMQSAKGILNLLKKGLSVGLCSKAGYPGISDPGYRIISMARKEGITVHIIPGPSAVTTALLSSGLPSSSFTFKGFPPRKKGQRMKFLEREMDQPHTLIFFESPIRTGHFLSDACEILGNRMGAVCIELTKMFEEIHRDYLQDLSNHFREKKIKGEVTIVIAGNNPKFLKKS